MKSIRDFVARLEAVESQPERAPELSLRTRRIAVPESGAFTMDRTILRTCPMEPVERVFLPGTPAQVVQALQWLDLPSTGQAFGDNDLGVDLAAVLALATGRRVVFGNELALSQ